MWYNPWITTMCTFILLWTSELATLKYPSNVQLWAPCYLIYSSWSISEKLQVNSCTKVLSKISIPTWNTVALYRSCSCWTTIVHFNLPLLCSSTSFLVLHKPESWWKYFFRRYQTFRLILTLFNVLDMNSIKRVEFKVLGRMFWGHLFIKQPIYSF